MKDVRSKSRAGVWTMLLCLVVGVCTWNVAFDSRIQAAEKRYLAMQARHEPGVTIRGVMDPAIHQAALAATAWSVAAAAATLLGVFIVSRRRRTSPSVSPSSSGSMPSRP